MGSVDHSDRVNTVDSLNAEIFSSVIPDNGLLNFAKC